MMGIIATLYYANGSYGLVPQFVKHKRRNKQKHYWGSSCVYFLRETYMIPPFDDCLCQTYELYCGLYCFQIYISPLKNVFQQKRFVGW